MKEEVERIKKLVGIDHNRWEQPCTCDKCKNMCKVPCIIGRIGGIFYDFLAKRNERREAFGGRKFDIVLDNGEIEKCEGQWWDAATDRAREELEKEGNPLSKMVLIGVSSVDRLLDCYVYYGLWASESKIEEMIADYKGRIYEYYEFKEEVINKIRQSYT